jgi:hypothetical protein
VVRVAGRLCVQRRGIAQGGVASGLLAALAYGDGLEAPGAPLGELCARRAVCVIRGVDDFLVVSAERESVEAFLRTMLEGVPDVGVSAKRQKMAVNFDVELDGQPVRKVDGGRFPFCGMAVDTRTLEVLKSSEALDRRRGVADGLTVEAGARPGNAFRSRAANALHLQMQPVLLDPRLDARRPRERPSRDALRGPARRRRGHGADAGAGRADACSAGARRGRARRGGGGGGGRRCHR